MNDPIADLCALLARLPGIGERTAARLAYFILGTDAGYAAALGQSVSSLHSRVRRCERCGNYALEARCRICTDSRRESRILCVVARPQDISALERGHAFSGRYFVLHGLLSPLDGRGPESLPVAEFLALLDQEPIEEVILATPLSVEGEATALFLAQELRDRKLRCTRIASGLPHGGELEYSDQVTLSRAFEGRREL